jgi:uncharacterized protein (TIGR02145 family)
MNSIIKTTGVILIALAIFSCKKDKRVFPPVVTTSDIQAILYTSALTGGVVTDEGGSSVVTRGVCWAANTAPTVFNSVTYDGTGDGEFISTIYGLTPGIKYYVRAYATNGVGTTYGDELTFTTKVPLVKFNNSLTYGTVTDADGKTYKTIPIGNQIWMAENLKTTKFNDGTLIPLVTSSSSWTNVLSPAYCWFDNDNTLYENIYGGFYNWFAVNTGKLCPAGWHVPSDSEWQQMIDFLGGNSTAGSKLKETGDNNWIAKNADASNTSGFTAMPAGLRRSGDGIFGGAGSFGGWWSTTELNSSPLGTAWARYVSGDTTAISRSEIFKIDGFSVRCLQNSK